jgi:hypothetical protein
VCGPCNRARGVARGTAVTGGMPPRRPTKTPAVAAITVTHRTVVAMRSRNREFRASGGVIGVCADLPPESGCVVLGGLRFDGPHVNCEDPAGQKHVSVFVVAGDRGVFVSPVNPESHVRGLP